MRVAVVFALFALAACQTPCPAPESQATRLVYSCEDGSSIAVTYSSSLAMVEQEGYVTLTLNSSVSGVRYAGHGAELRRGISDTRWTRPGAAETTCRPNA